MIKFYLSAIVALVLIWSPALAEAKQEVEVKRVIWEMSDFPELETASKAVCDGTQIKSAKLQVACKDQKFPSVTKAGAFRNVGIGAELNALIRQTAPATAEKK
jgi:hypothetical protein